MNNVTPRPTNTPGMTQTYETNRGCLSLSILLLVLLAISVLAIILFGNRAP